jgi:hypothetical protein
VHPSTGGGRVFKRRFEKAVSDHAEVNWSKREERINSRSNPRSKLMVPEMILLFFHTSLSYCSLAHLPIEVN